MLKDCNTKFPGDVRRVAESHRKATGRIVPGNSQRSVGCANTADASSDSACLPKDLVDHINRAVAKAMECSIQEILQLCGSIDRGKARLECDEFIRESLAEVPEVTSAKRNPRVAEPSHLENGSTNEEQNFLEHTDPSPNRKGRPSSAQVTAKHANFMNSRIQELSRALSIEKSRYDSAKGEIEKLSSEIQFLLGQLKVLHQESQHSKLQVGELSGRLAKLSGPPVVEANQSLTWEERKFALLEQLEAECEISNRDRRDELLEVQNIIDETSGLLQHKDTEIKSLKALLEQQSISTDSLAIGATAVGEIVERDELILAERHKLRSLREQWEEKQRQFEIEMSLERAKLARDRFELQGEQHGGSTRQYSSGIDPTRYLSTEESNGHSRWLAHLGLQND